MIVLTNRGLEIVKNYIADLKAKRKEIMDADKDTCDDTSIPSINDIIEDIEYFDDDENYYNNWGVTDNYDGDYPLDLTKGIDYIETEHIYLNRKEDRL